MMLRMTAGAGHGRVRGLERDRCGMAARTGQAVVLRVGELDGTAPTVVPRHGNGHLHGTGRGELVRLVAGLAVGPLGTLVMTDLTAAGRLERE